MSTEVNNTNIRPAELTLAKTFQWSFFHTKKSIF